MSSASRLKRRSDEVVQACGVLGAFAPNTAIIRMALSSRRPHASNGSWRKEMREMGPGALVPRSVADWFYFELESFLDSWRRQGMSEDVVRAALDRANSASQAIETVGKRMTAAHHL